MPYSFKPILLVPKLQLGNREAEAPASRDWKLELENEYKKNLLFIDS